MRSTILRRARIRAPRRFPQALALALGAACVAVAASSHAADPHAAVRSNSSYAGPAQGVSRTCDPARPEPDGGPRAARVRRWNADAFAAYERDDLPRALALYRSAAAAGDASARYNVAVMRIRGETAWPRMRAAFRLLECSAAAGFAPAQYMLGSLIDDGRLLRGAPQAATAWFEKAAAQGHPDAMLELGVRYDLGRGAAQDDARAAHWYEKSADAGDVGAQYLIASMYEHGRGVPLDLDAALRWYGAAARQGDVAARGQARAIAERLARERAG